MESVKNHPRTMTTSALTSLSQHLVIPQAEMRRLYVIAADCQVVPAVREPDMTTWKT